MEWVTEMVFGSDLIYHGLKVRNFSNKEVQMLTPDLYLYVLKNLSRKPNIHVTLKVSSLIKV